MRKMLQYAVSHKQWMLKTEFGGKTGTTNDFVDGWFMGVTPNLIVGTWVGGFENYIRFLNINEGQGGRMARPFFIDFMQRLEKDPSKDFIVGAKFETLHDIGIEIDCSKYTKMEKEENERLDEIKKAAVKAEGDDMEEDLEDFEEFEEEEEDLDEDEE